MPWPTIELREVLRLDLDRVVVDPAKTYDMVGVYSFGRGLFHRAPVLGSETSYKFFYRLKVEHVVLSQLFGWEGALALSSEEYAGAYVSPQFPTFLCDTNKLNRHFLGWLMRQPPFWQDLATRTKGMGDRRRTLNPEALLASTIPLPPYKEQLRIVAVVEGVAGKVGELLSLRSEAAKQTETLTGACEVKLLGSSKSTPWETKPLEKVCSVFLDCDHQTPEYVDAGVPLVRPRDVRAGFLDLTATVKIDLREHELRCRRHVPTYRDIIYSRELSYGNAGMVPANTILSLGQGTVLMHADPDFVEDEFLLRVLNAPIVREQAQAVAKGAAHPHVNLEDIRHFLIPIPSLNQQSQIVSILDDLESKIENLRREQRETSRELDSLIPSILNKAIDGDLHERRIE
jgi:type I restriction enzyme S subunit